MPDSPSPSAPLTSPIDAVHADSVLAVASIRDVVAFQRWKISRWTPAPCPAKVGR